MLQEDHAHDEAVQCVARSFRQKIREGLRAGILRLTVRALATFPDDAPAAELEELRGVASACAADFLRSPDVFQFDLAERPVIAQLAADPTHAPLFRLLHLVLQGDVSVRPHMGVVVQYCRCGCHRPGLG